MSDIVYSFEQQIGYWKQGEEIVFKHLMSKKEAVAVTDLSENREYQSLWIDGMYIYENEATGIMHSFFFDVKTDMQMHKRDTIFVETSSDYTEKEKIKDGILSTKAEYFLYYDPVLGRILWLPIFPFREWYKSKWISRVHYPVKGSWGFTTEWLIMSISELRELFPFLELELEVQKMSNNNV